MKININHKIWKTLKKYDATIRDYYEARTGGKRVEGWTDQIERGLRHTTRQDIKAFLASKNLGIK